MSSNSYVNLKIATCLVRYADDRLIDQRFLSTDGLGIGAYVNGLGGASSSNKQIAVTAGLRHRF
ncbi:hypothetical protein A8D97_05040 [Burkholderia cenocepacia]|nr:hypothetical protein A8D97_05040 [Burkholderia cenocepacia]ONQ41080.1 hypothetical protein A8D98_05290 [Burkholderia cenocepacia]ONQ60363.1 hypothetical protein A8D99_04665 [Burkholderia cenocepacia]